MKRHHQVGKRKGRPTFRTSVSFRQRQKAVLIKQKSKLTR